MRKILWSVVNLGLLAQFALAAAVTSSTDAAAAPDTNSTEGNGSDSPAEVIFLQTLQTAQISSMSCLITLINMTYNPIGTCLGLNTLTPLVIAPPDNGTFSAQLESYLGTVCGGTQCADSDISEAKDQLAQSCQGSKDSDLVKVLSAILDNYTNSYRTLACAVHFNGTADLCLPATLNSSSDGDTNTFFNDLITGSNLQQYQSSIFGQATCTGCMYEMYKAAVYMMSSIRTSDITHQFGDHLQQTCSNEDGVDWSNVQDQQIPDALQIQQSTTTPGGTSGAMRTKWIAGGLEGLAVNGWAVAVGVGVIGRILGGLMF